MIEKIKKTGKIIVIVAPSGTGKSTLIQRLFNDYPDLEWSVSYTTRKPRSGEVNGKDYYFIPEEEFLKIKAEGGFIEFAKVHCNWYGTARKVIEEDLNQGHYLLFDLDVQGADAFRKTFQNRANIIFIAPPSVDVLERRLRGRGTESEENLKIRLANAVSELDRKNDYDYCVINDDFENAYRELSQIIKKILT